MKLKFIHIVLLIFVVGNSYSQDPVTDSLTALLQTVKADTSRVKVLNALFLQYEFRDAAKAQSYLDEAFDLSRKISDQNGLANTYIHKGYFSEDKGNFPEALKNYQSALKIRTVMKDKKGIADAHGNIGNVYTAQGLFPLGLENFLISLKIREEIGDRRGAANSHNNIGAVQTYQGNYPEALKSYFACMSIYDSLGEKNILSNTYNNVGNLYYSQKNYEEALKNYFVALKIRNSIGDKRGQGMSYNNIGVVYADQGNYSEALKNHSASLKIREELGDKRGIGVSYNNLGLVLYAEAATEKDPGVSAKKLSEALKNYQSSIKIKEEIGDKAGMAGTLQNIGSVLFRQKNYTEAGRYLMKARDLAVEIGYKEIIRSSYGGLAALDSARGNYKGAYENHKQFVVYRDSLDNEETRKRTIQSQMTYDFEKKEAVANAEHRKELENQELIASEKSRKQKVVLLLVSCFLLLVAVFAAFIFRSLRTTKKQKNIIEEQKNVVEQQKTEVEHQKAIVDEHQKEIIDSIRYARRIQRSLLPTEIYIDKAISRLKKK